MVEMILTQATFPLCMAVFARLFTFRRGALQFHRFKSFLAYVVMASMAITAIHMLMVKLVMPIGGLAAGDPAGRGSYRGVDGRRQLGRLAAPG